MSKLSAFLRPTPAGKTREPILDRFVDEEGKAVPFVIQCLSAGKSDAIMQLCTDKEGQLNAAEFGDRMIVESMVEPNLKEAELCQYYGVMDPLDVPGIMFSPGEKKIVEDAVMDINDMKYAIKKLKEAKNS